MWGSFSDCYCGRPPFLPQKENSLVLKHGFTASLVKLKIFSLKIWLPKVTLKSHMCIKSPTLEISRARLTNYDDPCSQSDLQQFFFKFIHDDESCINGSRHIGHAQHVVFASIEPKSHHKLKHT